MKIKREGYYYGRDQHRRPLVTVCILEDANNNVGRGIAICSPADNPSKSAGRTLARDRAEKAIWAERMVGFSIDRTEAHHVMQSVDGVLYFLHKSYYNPDLLSIEKRILKRENHHENEGERND